MTKFFLIAVMLITVPCFAKYDGKIVEIKRELSLDKKNYHHKEYYLNIGANKGVKKNQIIPVLRKRTLIDTFANKTAGDYWLPVGEIKILHVEPSISIARIHHVPTRKKLPELDYETFMVGDHLDIKKAHYRNPASRSKKYSKYRNRNKSKGRKSYNRGIASVRGKSGKVFNGNYSFPDPVRDELTRKINGKGLELNGTSATGINTQYKIKAN